MRRTRDMHPTVTLTYDRLDDEARWQVVQQRDARFRGVFYYAVRSTGIFCRPGCPSRLPERSQVQFFPSTAEALAAGYRPCRRCHPTQPSSPGDPADLVRQAIRLLDENPDSPLTLRDLSARLHLSPAQLHRSFKAATGLTPRQYAIGQRLMRFRGMVRESATVTQAVYEAGYPSSSRLYENARSQLGMTPKTYQRGGAGMTIYYTILDCALGRMLVAATQKGISAVSFADEDAPLERFIHAEYPSATLQRDDATLKSSASAIVEHLAGSLPNLDLPLDVQGTAFQLRVWEELRRIPYGELRTYTQVAEAMGNPKAVRAVASACASNPAAVVTPCHRVIRSDGSLGGYRWGLQRKEKLIDTERKTR